jgi:hypothetical protein
VLVTELIDNINAWSDMESSFDRIHVQGPPSLTTLSTVEINASFTTLRPNGKVINTPTLSLICLHDIVTCITGVPFWSFSAIATAAFGSNRSAFQWTTIAVNSSFEQRFMCMIVRSPHNIEDIQMEKDTWKRDRDVERNAEFAQRDHGDRKQKQVAL